jgi:hypothetical protein
MENSGKSCRENADAYPQCRRRLVRTCALERAIQYDAAYRFNHDRLWNTGSPAYAGDDTEDNKNADALFGI